MKIEARGSGPSTKILVDDIRLKDATIKTQENINLPFGLVYLNNQRVYDAEFWVDGALQFIIPPWRELVDLAYMSVESGDWRRVDSILNNVSEPKLNLLRRVARLSEMIEASQERRMLLLWQSWGRVISVFNDNARELAAIVDGIESDDGPPDVTFEFLPHLDRALINYVVSSKFALDHLKWLKKRLPSRPEFGAIPSRLGKIEKVEVVAFASILRNHLTHGSMVDPSQRMEFTEGATKFTLNLIPRVLLDEEDPKNPHPRAARLYIEKHAERLSIKEFAGDLNKNILEFYETIFDNVKTWHEPEISRLTQWRDELNELKMKLALISQHDPVVDIEPLSYDLTFR